MSNQYAGLVRAMREDPGAARRCAGRLLAIREQLAPLRARKSDATLLLATWNIRDFDSNAFGWGPRLPETFYYIAEMMACFDLVAVQEVNRDLSALERVMRILGREWDYICTDATEGRGGNDERMAFVFNTEKVWFRKVAGEVVLPQGQLIVSKGKVEAKGEGPGVEAVTSEMRQQFARTPFLVAFQSGWFRLSLCTVHIYYGADSGEKLRRRIGEIDALVRFFADRQDRETAAQASGAGPAENYILLGDFNVVSPEHRTMASLASHGFTVPEQIDGDAIGDREHYYDQIAVRVADPRFRVTGGGMIDMFRSVFRDDAEDRAIYGPRVPARDPETDASRRAGTPEELYRAWRTWQMSDHAPLWVEIATDFTEDYLRGIAA